MGSQPLIFCCLSASSGAKEGEQEENRDLEGEFCPSALHPRDGPHLPVPEGPVQGSKMPAAQSSLRKQSPRGGSWEDHQNLDLSLFCAQSEALSAGKWVVSSGGLGALWGQYCQMGSWGLLVQLWASCVLCSDSSVRCPLPILPHRAVVRALGIIDVEVLCK